MKRIGILTSGGDAPGMNAAIRAAVRKTIKNGNKAYGICHGYRGLIDGDIRLMEVSDVGDIIHRGGTVLKTARCEEFKTEAGIKKAAASIKNANLDSVIAIGGDGTLKGLLDLEKLGINVFLIPATIDNDLGYTDYSIGFDTAVNTVVNAINNIRETGMSHDKTTIIEVMGRKCGDIALRAGLAGGADAVLVPEEKTDIEAVIEKVKCGKARCKKNNIIIRAEGADISMKELTNSLGKTLDEDIRTVILGYLQRGGSPSAFDRNIATLMGVLSADLADAGTKNSAIGFDGNKAFSISLDKAAATEKEIPLKFLKIVDELS